MRTAYIGKTRKCSSTIGSILISKAFDAAVLTAIMNSHIDFTRHAKGKKYVFISIPRWYVLNGVFFFLRLFFGNMVYFFVGK